MHIIIRKIRASACGTHRTKVPYLVFAFDFKTNNYIAVTKSTLSEFHTFFTDVKVIHI